MNFNLRKSTLTSSEIVILRLKNRIQNAVRSKEENIRLQKMCYTIKNKLYKIWCRPLLNFYCKFFNSNKIISSNRKNWDSEWWDMKTSKKIAVKRRSSTLFLKFKIPFERSVKYNSQFRLKFFSKEFFSIGN